MATDRIIDPSPSIPCGKNILPWIILMSLFTVMLFWVAYKRQTIFNAAKLKANGAASKRTPRSVPLVLVFSWLNSFVVLLLLILPFFGVDARNGGSVVLLQMMFGVIATKSLLMLMKVIKLGRKIIPLSAKAVDNMSTTSSTVTSGLSDPDSILKVLLAVNWAIVGFQTIPLVVLTLAATDLMATWVTVFFALGAVFGTLFPMTIFYQYHRCILAVLKISEDVQLNNEDHTKDVSAFNLAIHRMRTQQTIVVIGAVFSLGVYGLCAASIIPRHYAVVVAITASDVLLNYAMMFSMTSSSGTHKSSRQPASNNKTSNDSKDQQTQKAVEPELSSPTHQQLSSPSSSSSSSNNNKVAMMMTSSNHHPQTTTLVAAAS